MLNKKATILKRCAIFFLLLGAIGWFVPFIGWPFGSWIESPNSEPHGIVLDSSGNIYCGSKFYGRIQKYNPDGKYERGFETEGGNGWGSDFGFRIDDKGQLRITVSGISKDNKGSVHRIKIYDKEGNLVSAEKNQSTQRNYTHKMSNTTFDSNGNAYVFKGFVFPRVVKETKAGDESIKISTPLLLWFIQAPFPSFAFFFVSMFILIFLGFKSDAKKLSISTIDLIVDKKKLPSVRKFVFIVIGILGIVISLCVLIPVGLKTYPFLIYFGFISFWITMLLIALVAIPYAMIDTWRCAKADFNTFKKLFNPSLKVRYEASSYLRSLMDKDPVMQKAHKVSSTIAKLCLLTWFVILVLAICVVLYLDHIGVWQELINK
jgi:hypothetical protein